MDRNERPVAPRMGAGRAARAILADRPDPGTALAVTAAIALFMLVLRFRLYPSQIVPFGYGLPLMIGLWHRDRRLHWGLTVVFLGMVTAKAAMILTRYPGSEPDLTAFAGMQVLNILGTAVAVEAANLYRRRLENSRSDLERINTELETANEELVSREEEVTQQNEELQGQAEELETQAEELRAQGEELVQANLGLSQRSELLETLLRYGQEHVGYEQVIHEVCRAAAHILGGPEGSAGITERRGDMLRVVTWTGFEAPRAHAWPFANSVAAIAIERNGTAAVHDLALRPDLVVPVPASGAGFRSILVTPYRLNGAVAGVLEVYRPDPHEFTEDEFRMIEWTAAQCGLLLDTLSLHREILDHRRAAEQSSARKSQFLAAVSHDIRTPANAITLMAELIRRYSEIPEKRREVPALAADLQNASRSLVELVSDVLDLTRYDTGRQELQETEFALRSVLEAEFRQFAAQAGLIDLVLDLEEDVYLRTDRVKLARTLDNLISNALKFTERGEVRVRVAAEPDGSRSIDVIDTGIGIDRKHLSAIFDEFLQLRNPERDRNKGTGLGLAISRRLADAIGCTISVESEPGSGSTFRLTLPPSLICERPPEIQELPAPIPHGDGEMRKRPLSGVRVLLVEDHESMRRSAARLLTEYGACVIEAEQGQEALQALMHEDPDVLLLDLMLPDMDGREILQAIPRLRPCGLRCVLVVTGDVSAARIEEVRDLGADHLIAKPIEAHALVEEITARLRAKNALSPAAEMTAGDSGRLD